MVNMMNKTAITNFLTTLQEFSSERDNIRNARRDCFLYKWNQITLEKIEYGIMLFHHKPSMLNDYINEIKEDKTYDK